MLKREINLARLTCSHILNFFTSLFLHFFTYSCMFGQKSGRPILGVLFKHVTSPLRGWLRQISRKDHEAVRYMGQEGQGQQGNRAYTRSIVGFR